MNKRQRDALDWAVQEAQDRHRRNANRDVEQEYRESETEAQQRRGQFHVVDGGHE